MAATASFLQWNPLKWKQFPPSPPPIPAIRSSSSSSVPFPLRTAAKPASRLTVRSSFAAKHLCSSNDSNNAPTTTSSSSFAIAETKDENNKTAFERLRDAAVKALEAIKKPAIAAILVAALLMYDPASAFAASGGRMGGRSFSRSSSSSSRSYSVPRGSSPGFSYSAPYYGPSPFGGGGIYVGPAVGVGVGAGSGLFLILAGFAAFVLVSGFLSDRDEGGILTATEKTSVLKLQVGLLGMARSLQKDLNKIAEVADTSSSQGLSYVLTETSLSLLRHPDYCISAYSAVDVKRSMEEGEKRFNQLSIEERGKFDEETLVNVNSIKRQSTKSQRANGFSNEYIVITILVAAEGVHKLPVINSVGDLKEALQKLGAIPTSNILAVEVLWTPQNENDTLSERELLQDYSLLRPL